MQVGRMLALVGGALLVAAVLLLPIMSWRGAGVTWFSADVTLDKVLAITTLALGALAILVVLLNRAVLAIPLGLVAFGVVGYEYFRVKGTFVANNPPPELAELVPAINMLGWAGLGAGALLVLAGGLSAMRSGASAPPAA